MRIPHVFAVLAACFFCTGLASHSVAHDRSAGRTDNGYVVVVVSIPCEHDSSFATACTCSGEVHSIAVATRHLESSTCLLAVSSESLSQLRAGKVRDDLSCVCHDRMHPPGSPSWVREAMLRVSSDDSSTSPSTSCVIPSGAASSHDNAAVPVLSALLSEASRFRSPTLSMSDDTAHLLIRSSAHLAAACADGTFAPTTLSASWDGARSGRMLLETRPRSHQNALEPHDASHPPPLLLERSASSRRAAAVHVAALHDPLSLGSNAHATARTAALRQPQSLATHSNKHAGAPQAATRSAHVGAVEHKGEHEHMENEEEEEEELDAGWQAEIAMLKAVSQRLRSKQREQKQSAAAQRSTGAAAKLPMVQGSEADTEAALLAKRLLQQRQRSSWISRAQSSHAAAAAAAAAGTAKAGKQRSASTDDGMGLGIGALLETQARAVLSTMTGRLDGGSGSGSTHSHSGRASTRGPAHLQSAAAAAASHLQDHQQQQPLPADTDPFTSVFARLLLPKQRAAETKASKSSTLDQNAAVEQMGAAAPQHPSAVAAAGVHIAADGTLREDYTSSPTQRLQQLRARVAVDLFGPALADQLLSHSAAAAAAVDDAGETEQQRHVVATAQSSAGNATGRAAAHAHRNAAASSSLSSSPSSSATTGSSDSPLGLFLELQANAHARVVPFLKMILTPVVDGVMKPVLKVAINMMAPHLGENVQENIQARTTTQVPADVAKTVSNNGGPALGKSLADMLAGTLSKSLAASLTLRLGPRLRDSITDAAVPRIATAVARDVTATVVDRLTPKLVAGTAGLISRSLTAILSRSLPHALSSVLSASLNPLHMPPPTAEQAALRQAQCKVCSAFRDGRSAGVIGAASAVEADAAAKGGVGVTGSSAVPGFGPIAGSPLHGFAGGFPGLAFPGVAGGDRMPYGTGLDAAGAAGAPWDAASLLEEAASVAAAATGSLANGGTGGAAAAADAHHFAGSSTGGATRSAAAAESLIPASPAAPVSAFPGAGLGISESLACYLCEHGTARERNVDAFVTQQVAHYHAEHYSRYYAGYYDKAHAAAVPPPKEK